MADGLPGLPPPGFSEKEKKGLPGLPPPGFASSPETEPDYWGAAMQGLGDLVTGPYALGKSALSAVSSHPGMDPFAAMGVEAGKYLYENPKAIAPAAAGIASGAIGVMGSPVAGALSMPTLQYGAQRVNDYFWPDDAQTPTQQVEQLVRDITGSAAGIGVPKMAAAGSNLIAKGINYFDNAPIKQKATWQSAQTPGATATALNSPRGTTLTEGQIPEGIAKHESTFLEMNPMNGIEDVPGESALGKLKQNLLTQKEAANAAKGQLIAEADRLGPGLSLDDLDTSGLENLKTRGGISPFSDASTADDILLKTRSAFRNNYNENLGSNRLTATQAQELIRSLDDRIELLRGYDDLAAAQKTYNPSVMANVRSELAALKAARGSLSEQLTNYVDTATGRPGELARLNDKISTALEYEPTIQRRMTEILQGETAEFAPGRSMTGPTSVNSKWNEPFNFAMNEATGGYLKNRAIQRGRLENLRSDYRSVKRLQEIESMRGQPMGPVEHSPAFTFVNKGAEGFRAVMDALQPILPALASFDPQTLRIHDPNERRMVINATQNSSAPLAVKAKAISDLNGGKLPTGLEIAGPQPVQMPEVGLAYEAAGNALGVGEDIGSSPDWTTEDDRITQMMDEVDYDRSGY